MAHICMSTTHLSIPSLVMPMLTLLHFARRHLPRSIPLACTHQPSLPLITIAVRPSSSHHTPCPQRPSPSPPHLSPVARRTNPSSTRSRPRAPLPRRRLLSHRTPASPLPPLQLWRQNSPTARRRTSRRSTRPRLHRHCRAPTPRRRARPLTPSPLLPRRRQEVTVWTSIVP